MDFDSCTFRLNFLFRHNFILPGILFLLISVRVFAQHGSVFVHHLKDDFPEMEPWVNKIAMDNKGFVWFGGDEVIQKFDGYSLKTYPIRNFFNQSEENFQTFSSVGFLTDSYDNFLVFVNRGFFIYHHDFDTFTRIDFEPPFEYFYDSDNNKPEETSITSFMEDNRRNLWLGTDIGLLFYIPLDTIQKVLHKDQFPPKKIYISKDCITPVNFISNQKHDKIPGAITKKDYPEKRSTCPEIVKILQDNDGDIWVNTYCRIFRLVLHNGKWSYGGIFFENSPVHPHWTKNIFLDKEKNLWIGVRNYLVCKQKGKSEFASSKTAPNNLISLTKPIAFDTIEYPVDFHFSWYEFPHEMGFQGHTGWIDNLHLFYDNQLFVVNEKSVLSYTLTRNEKGEPLFNKINEFIKSEYDENYWKVRPTDLLLTREGILFSGDWSYGVLTTDMNYHQRFRKLYNIPGDPNSLPKLYYSSMLDLGNNCLLLGGRKNTIYKTDYHYRSFEKLPVQIDYAGSVDDFIIKIITDGHGRIWIANMLGKAAIFDEKCISPSTQNTQCSQQIIASNFGFRKNESMHINDMVLDKDKTMWISTDQGIYYIDLPEYGEVKDWNKIVFNEFNRFQVHGDSVLFRNIEYMISVKDDFLLLVSDKGLFQFNPLSREYWRIKYDTLNGNNNPVIGFRVYDVDRTGKIWTTDLSNLSSITFLKTTQYPPYEADIKTYTTDDGFPFRPYEFNTDDKNNLWIYPESSNRGIVRYETDKDIFTYFKGPGIINGAIFGVLHGKDLSGNLYFGAMDGITIFHPDSIKINSYIPPTLITDIKVLYKSIFLIQDTARLLELRDHNRITLHPNENVLNIEFSTLSYANPSANQYAYYLSGFDKDTIYTNASNRIATYSNLAPGSYQFYLKGSNNNAKWNNNWTHLQIVVLPPWYATIIAYIIYGLIFVGLITGWRKYDLRRIRLTHEVKLKQAETEKLKELDHMKSEFFSNISHEFRTPLTLILGPLENILKGNFIGNIHKEAEIMKRNASRLLRLINTILDLSKLDTGKLKLHASEQDLSVFIRNAVANFESAARDKKIQLIPYISKKPVMVYFDSEKMEVILENILSNALKFTTSGGKVTIRLNLCDLANDEPANNKIAEIIIKDTGIGIPPEEIDRIFDRFYQIDSSHTRKHEGTGIGLALVNELVKLHHGTITVQSQPGIGTSFTILLPVGRDHLSNEDIVLTPAFTETHFEYKDISGILQADLPSKDIFIDKDFDIKNSLLPLILIVEDNADMRHFIKNNLDHQFAFIEAENGNRGFDISCETIPDLIISDVMMPGMDGFKFCKKIREDERTRHIPFIMLTAKAGKESILSGYETGADDYVIKPFDQEILVSRILNLLRERKLLREKFSSKWITGGDDTHIVTADEKFIKRINEILEKYYSNPDFGTRLFVQEAGMSRSVLFRKMKSVSNHSPNIYLRNFRLLKALQMIRSGDKDISEVAYSAGFNNLSYFSRCFKQLFGKSPHDYYHREIT